MTNTTKIILWSAVGLIGIGATVGLVIHFTNKKDSASSNSNDNSTASSTTDSVLVNPTIPPAGLLPNMQAPPTGSGSTTINNVQDTAKKLRIEACKKLCAATHPHDASRRNKCMNNCI